jgi:hypothetical protein
MQQVSSASSAVLRAATSQQYRLWLEQAARLANYIYVEQPSLILQYTSGLETATTATATATTGTTLMVDYSLIDWQCTASRSSDIEPASAEQSFKVSC